MRDRPRTRAEIYAMAQLRISWFESSRFHGADYASLLLEKHFEHVDRLIDKDIS